ncbi:MAG: insulinase family protein [Candidatus Aminicenantes bacterium]|nr:insulinase family protein [Candidatus Aminicenantes bacterium]
MHITTLTTFQEICRSRINYKKEKNILNKIDFVFQSILDEKGFLDPNRDKINKSQKRLDDLQKMASTFVISNQFNKILKENGILGIDAGTSKDFTTYFYALPSNRFELWAYMESSRLISPVFREFFNEREIIKEERRLRTENSIMGKLFEELQYLAFKSHPYRTNVIGLMSDIECITRPETKEFFTKHYTAKNMIIGIQGDISPVQVEKNVKMYFSKLKPGKLNHFILNTEISQIGEKVMTISDKSRLCFIIGYHCPSSFHKDFIKFKILEYLLTKGYCSRLYKKLITNEDKVLFIDSKTGFPGDKYSSLFVLYALPKNKFTNNEVIKSILSEIDNLKKSPVLKDELLGAKNRLKTDLLNNMLDEKSFLFDLLRAEMFHGSWEHAFDIFTEIENVTKEDIQTIVNKYFITSNRIIVKTENGIDENK